MRLREIMTTPAVTCPASSTLDQAARLMWEFDLGIVPVVDDQGHVAGVITDRDICMAAYTQGRPLAAISVGSAMASPVVAIHADEPVEQAEQLMADNQVRRLPVLNSDNHVVGMVSMNDLARLAARVHRTAVDREFVQALAAVSQPRAQHTSVHTALPTRA